MTITLRGVKGSELTHAELDENFTTLDDGKADKNIGINVQTGDYTLVAGDAGKSIELDKATAISVTVPASASVAFPVGTQIIIVQIGAGQVTVVEDSGVTVKTAETLLLAKQYAGATLYKRGTDDWVIVGNLEAV